jgi:N-glycosylase/DNA lyase
MPATIPVKDFNLAATLECGQAFRWSRGADGWYTGVVGGEVWRLRQTGNSLEWETEGHASAWPPAGTTATVAQKRDPPYYLSLDRDLSDIVATFPDDPHLRAAVQKYWGLRVLRQEPWETLATFIASSTKQIVQIRQIVELLSQRFGRARWPQRAAGQRRGEATASDHCFPTVEAIARASLPELQACKLGFRAKYLHAAARRIDRGEIRLEALPAMEYGRALEELLKLDGVGEKIANCTLLFSCGHDEAFPVDVWMKRALQRLPAGTDFGPYAGWAQQYLFYHERNLRPSPLTA